MTRNHWVWYLDVCGRLSFKNDMYVFFHVFVWLVLTFDQRLFMNYFEKGRAFGGIVDSGAPESVVVLVVRHDLIFLVVIDC